MKLNTRLKALPLTAILSLAAHAQEVPAFREQAAAARANAEQTQQVQQQQEARQRETAISARSVRSSDPNIATYPELKEEHPCFRIESFTLNVPTTLPEPQRTQGASTLPLDPFFFAREWLAHYRGRCIGRDGLTILTKALQQDLLSRGYLTTRVLVPEQDLTNGTLQFVLIPGVIHEIRFDQPVTWSSWRSAFPARPHDLLDVRALEQGIEQMKRVPSQDLDMKIEPTDQPGESDILLTLKRSKSWSIVTSIDNSGTRATGKPQGNLGLGLDNPLGLNDVLTLGATQDLKLDNKTMGSHGFNGTYSVPWGYWTATLFGYTNSYRQQIAGANQTFTSSGESQTAGVKLARVLRRSQNDVFAAYIQLSRRFNASFINDTEIDIQHRNNTFLETGLTDRHYIGNSQLDAALAFRQGIGGFGSTPGPTSDQTRSSTSQARPTYRYRMGTLDFNLSVPFALAHQPLRYVTTFRGQHSPDRLFYVDDFTIGSRYTVRGFDGEQMLAAESGFYWRNEVQAPLGQWRQSIYVGIDYGRVFGPNTAFLAGTQLLGAVLSIRGGVPLPLAALKYDLFAGTPLIKPASLATARVTIGFQLTAQL
ncbi:ShlB/FhaC/HecB family hemolysin secretion/activation protein [Caballeronia sp. LZ035]|uniref:ShlB/FhaC/HecB family hemolysin secretion/activation protein n=1 Tax=Caballeronia sp. LZ035 TaxID=3038568 RepID=UPI00285F076F|nr:ShlB/FhaC/HecB family hemolysin secretion/activation protein [Caballeronia sp. LZ035]MDR5762504.1 ShlB/FhaC/HecB family hemolysin secretion/activation protein [Caballeronia sp. LZ035]